jgi:hypothetical protein
MQPLPVYFVDNVITTGATIVACRLALGWGTGLAYADASTRGVATALVRQNALDHQHPSPSGEGCFSGYRSNVLQQICRSEQTMTPSSLHLSWLISPDGVSSSAPIHTRP